MNENIKYLKLRMVFRTGRGLALDFMQFHWLGCTSLRCLGLLIGQRALRTLPSLAACGCPLCSSVGFGQSEFLFTETSFKNTKLASRARHVAVPALTVTQITPVHPRKNPEPAELGVPVLHSSTGPGEARREQMEPAPVKAKPQGRLLLSTQLDAKDELEEVG